MEVVNLVFGKLTDKIPSHQTVLDWVEKCGLSEYSKAKEKLSLSELDYAIVMDNSITMGGQDLHLELAAPARHPGHALQYSDVEVIDMSVGMKWNKDMVTQELANTIAQVGRPPEYIVTDNGKIMTGAIANLGLPGHRDISHSFGACLEQVYGSDPEYSDLVQKMGYARKYAHTSIANLMPPKRRAYARFMNVFDSIRWAYGVLQSDILLPKLAQERFGFTKGHASLIAEMQEVMDAFRRIESICKNDGLSKSTVQECKQLICRTLMTSGERPRKLGKLLLDYFDRESKLLENDIVCHNISSDVIESVFGHFKDRMSPNQNNGFTALTLVAPLHLKMATPELCADFSIRERLKDTTLTLLHEWKRKALLPNTAAERSKLLKTA